MGYYHINDLYKDQAILNFKECYALEKIHGTSAHISYKDGQIEFFSGGSNHKEFVKLFDVDFLRTKLVEMSPPDETVYVYGEAYGGKLQGMSAAYGPKLCFVVFDVKVANLWLAVPIAEQWSLQLRLPFVHYVKIPTTLAAIDEQRDADSVQSVRNGMGSHIREGIVLRPVQEYTKNNGERVIAKHKRDEFRETQTVHKVNPDKLIILADARAIADEWVTEERLNHLLTNGSIALDITQTGNVIKAMLKDIRREAAGEVVLSREAERRIGTETAIRFKRRLKEALDEGQASET